MKFLQVIKFSEMSLSKAYHNLQVIKVENTKFPSLLIFHNNKGIFIFT